MNIEFIPVDELCIFNIPPAVVKMNEYPKKSFLLKAGMIIPNKTDNTFDVGFTVRHNSLVNYFYLFTVLTEKELNDAANGNKTVFKKISKDVINQYIDYLEDHEMDF